MKRKSLAAVLALSFLPFSTPTASAVIDLQGDLERIISGINRFDANSATSASVSNISDVKRITSNNATILQEIKNANAVFKQDLNKAKRLLPSRDTKDSPAFSTLMNLAKGYEQWLKYQYKNQSTAQSCIKKAGSSYDSFSLCLVGALSKTLENERVGRQKLEAAFNAWNRWQIKYGYA